MKLQTETSAAMPRRSSIREPSRRRLAGMTMIENLVAIVVLSFGMLGVVGLQAAALQGLRA